MERQAMKSAVFYGKHDLRIEELETPQPGKNELLIKVMACGICGTDVHIWNGDEGAAKTPSGTVLGHEFAGIVEAVGEGVTDFAAGDRVCVDPNKLCGDCDWCKNGIGHFCNNMIGIGTTVNGGFSEYCLVPRSQAYKIADSTTFEMAAMTEPLACCVHGMDMCEIQPGDTVAIIGGGMIGMLMLQLSRLSGAAKVILIEPVEEKRRKAKALGADICIDPRNEDVHAVLERNNVGRIAAVIECVGKISTIRQAISIAGKKSVVMMFGLTASEEELSIRPFELFKKEIVLKASYINPYTQNRALALIDSGRIDVQTVVASCEALEKLPEILDNPALRAKGKVIIRPWQ